MVHDVTKLIIIYKKKIQYYFFGLLCMYNSKVLHSEVLYIQTLSLLYFILLSSLLFL